VTIGTKNRECLFGEAVEGEMHLNEIGEMVQTVWEELPEYYSGIGIDVFQIMPNHVHGIIILNHEISGVGAGPCACPFLGQPRGVAPTMSLPDVVHRFKSLTTNRFRQIIKNYNCPLFPGQKFWQRNFYEHIVRNNKELNQIREYIQNNPLKWHLDQENPLRTGGMESLEDEIFGNTP